MAIKKFYTVQEINSLIDKVISYQRTIDKIRNKFSFKDIIKYRYKVLQR